MSDSDIYGSDPDQPGAELDESVGGEYPPDRPPRLDDTGGYVPEAWDVDEAAVYDEVELAGDADVGAVDDESELVGVDVHAWPARQRRPPSTWTTTTTSCDPAG